MQKQIPFCGDCLDSGQRRVCFCCRIYKINPIPIISNTDRWKLMNHWSGSNYDEWSEWMTDKRKLLPGWLGGWLVEGPSGQFVLILWSANTFSIATASNVCSLIMTMAALHWCTTAATATSIPAPLIMTLKGGGGWTEGSYNYNCFVCEYGAMMQLTFPLAQQPLRCFMGVKRTLIVNMSSSIVGSLPSLSSLSLVEPRI